MHPSMESFEQLVRFRLRDRIAFGLRAGARFGAYLGVLTALVAFVLRRTGDAAVPPVPAAGVVFLGALVGGMVFGVARPWVRDSYGAALLGAACLAPTMFGAAIAKGGLTHIDWGLALGVGGFTLILGSLLGVMSWRGWTRRY